MSIKWKSDSSIAPDDGDNTIVHFREKTIDDLLRSPTGVRWLEELGVLAFGIGSVVAGISLFLGEIAALFGHR